ncbi:hypothetical protein [Segetibacter koreensis]|uniref:hypothetical protein n=1 Tax=Segetibacter koreensis TaxID=398037 RepID=UPI0003669BCA|nr:hypothetical protein [Segetibacter koreensis]
MITFTSPSKSRASVIAFGFKEIGPYYWVGNCKNVDYYAGQTFRAPAHGILKSIKLFSSVVSGSADATLSLYEFDEINFTWKEKRAETTKYITKEQESQWIEFDFPDVEVKKDGYYAFKVSCKGGGMVAIAECPWNITNPYPEGVEWVGTSFLKEGNFHKDFDLAFEGEIEELSNAKFI